MPPKGSGGALARVEERRIWQEVDHLRFFLRYRACLPHPAAADPPDHAYAARSGPDPDGTPHAPGTRTTAPWVPAAERRADADIRLTREVERGDPYVTYPDSHWTGWEQALREGCTPVQVHCIAHYLLRGETSRQVADGLRWADPKRVTHHVNRGLRLMVLWLRDFRRGARNGQQASL